MNYEPDPVFDDATSNSAPQQRTIRRRLLSISIREWLMLLAVIGLVLTIVLQNMQSEPETPTDPGNALRVVEGPVVFTYWHQRGPNGSGNTGGINAERISIFDKFIIVDQPGGNSFMIPTDDLTQFKWYPR